MIDLNSRPLMPLWDQGFVVLEGRRYQWSGWHACQLESLEWLRVPAGTTRRMANREFRVFTTHREGLRIRTTWCMVGLDRLDLDRANEQIRALKEDLRSLI